MKVDKLAAYWELGLSVEDYLKQWSEKIEGPRKGLDKEARKYWFYSKYNYERQRLVEASYVVSDALGEAILELSGRQYWLVLTEDWCMDSAFSLPVLVRASALSQFIALRILARDQHPELMDLYLTNGARSIPKLISCDMFGTELFTWGARPAPLVALRTKWQQDGESPTSISQQSLAWYEALGASTVDREITMLLRNSSQEMT